MILKVLPSSQVTEVGLQCSWTSSFCRRSGPCAIIGESYNETMCLSSSRCVYDVTVEPEYEGDVITPNLQKVQVLIPGSPDPPEIWMRSIFKDEFIIEWGEPRLYGVRVHGYQVGHRSCLHWRGTVQIFPMLVRRSRTWYFKPIKFKVWWIGKILTNGQNKIALKLNK